MIPEEETHRAGPVLDETHPSMPKRDAIIGRILALSPSWQHSELQDFEFLSGGFSNLNIAFNRVHTNTRPNPTFCELPESLSPLWIDTTRISGTRTCPSPQAFDPLR